MKGTWQSETVNFGGGRKNLSDVFEPEMLMIKEDTSTHVQGKNNNL